jgi:hypothetical protein
MEPSPMLSSESRVNWLAILSYTGSLLFSVTIWAFVFRAVEHLAR